MSTVMGFASNRFVVDGFIELPRWARIALAARTVRRIQPLFLACWPKAPKKCQQNVERALVEAAVDHHVAPEAVAGRPHPALRLPGRMSR